MLARILYYYGYARYLEHTLTTPETIKAHQARRFAKLQKDTLSRSPFYKAYVGKPLEEWPIINKKIMMENFDDINTVNIQKSTALAVAKQAEHSRDFSPMIGDIAVGLSSGTSGHHGLFLVSPRERDFWAGVILAKAMPQGLRKKERIAFFLRANNRLYTTLSHSKTIQFHFFDLLEDFDAHIQRLNALQPTILSAPASVLLWLARHKAHLTIHPTTVFSVAEVLEPAEEQYLATVFGCPVSQIYQCTEGLLAISDRRTQQLNMNEHFLIIEKEWLDAHRFIPIITDLYRTTQPIIRYRLDDVLVVAPSESPLTKLAAIEGRLGDVCYAERGQESIPIFSDLIRQKMVSSPEAFEDYHIRQETLTTFHIQVTPEVQDRERLTQHLNQLFIQKHCTIPTWYWEPYSAPEPGVKRRRIQSCLMQKSMSQNADTPKQMDP